MNEFIILVEKMREAQKGFFAADHNSRERRDFLHESKKLESQVDKFIKDFKSNQPKLF